MPKRSLIVAGLLALSGAARADHPAFPGSPKAQRALDQYDNLDLDSALASFIAAAKDTKLPAEERALILAYAGLVAMTLGKQQDTRSLFGQAIDLDPKVTFPQNEAPPKISAFLEEVRKSKQVDLTAPHVVPSTKPDEFAEGAEGEGKKSSNVPLFLGIGGGVVAAAVVVVVIVLLLPKGAPCNAPSGTGCITVHPSN